jgi:hypothetical protein
MPALVLYGASFGASAADIVVTVNGAACAEVALLVPHAKLRALVPAAALRGAADRRGQQLEVAVSVRGVEGARIVAKLE